MSLTAVVQQTLSSSVAAVPANPPINHVLIVDCSGSMSGDLRSIREQIKDRIPTLLSLDDTFTVLWFSGSGESGVVFEGELIANIKDVARIGKLLDRWIVPVGLTGFVDPLKKLSEVMDRLPKNNPTAVVFMTDGYDNQNSSDKIFKALASVASKVASFTFVEYGYYANRPLLTAMAEKTGSPLLFAEGFHTYAPLLERTLTKGAPPSKITVTLEKPAPDGFVVCVLDGDVISFTVNEGDKVTVPEGVTDLFYLSSGKGTNGTAVDISGVYALISAYSARMKSDQTLALLKETGDVSLIKDFAGCFGKQRYSAFTSRAAAAAVNPSERLKDGYDPNAIPPEDAFTVLDLLKMLSEDESATLLLDHPEFSYQRISRGRVSSDTVLSPESLKKMEEITAKMAATKDKKTLQALSNDLNALTTGPAPLTFKPTPNPDGVPLTSLVYHETRPNVSILTRRAGTVDISGRLPHNLMDKLPGLFPTFVYRNYAIIKDGLVNVATLPVRLSKSTLDQIVIQGGSGILKSIPILLEDNRVEAVLSLEGLPILNRVSVRSVTAKDLFRKEYDLFVAQSKVKLYNSLLKNVTGTSKKDAGFSSYGPEAAAWLAEQGFTEHSGFSPKTVQAESTDTYMAKEVSVKLAGYSSIPSFNDVQKRIASGKPPTASGAVMAATFEAEKARGISEDRIANQRDLAVSTVRNLQREISALKFAISVGQAWPQEFASLDENTYEFTTKDGVTVKGSLEMVEVPVKI